jgi:hypothetical protein
MSFSEDFVELHKILPHEQRVNAGVALIQEALKNAKDSNPNGQVSIEFTHVLEQRGIKKDVLRLVNDSLIKQLGMQEAPMFSYSMKYGFFCFTKEEEVSQRETRTVKCNHDDPSCRGMILHF